MCRPIAALTAGVIAFGSGGVAAAQTDSVPAATAQAGFERDLGKLKVGQSAFWAGEPVSGSAWSGTPVAPGTAGEVSCAVAPCFDYTITVAPGGDRLRVALDHRNICDQFHLELRDPTSALVARGSTDAIQALFPGDTRTVWLAASKSALSCGYSEELIVNRPVPGRWTIRAIASRVTVNEFRMRAKLERAPKEDGRVREVLPDLVSTPPFEFTFAGGCSAQEVQEHAAKRCLRLSIGPQNRGHGALDLRYAPLQDTGSAGTVRQRIYNNGGTVSRERDAGPYEYHTSHGHYHYVGFGKLHLYRLEEDGTMNLVSEGPKVGACTGPYGLTEWNSFNAAPRNSAPHDCAVTSPANGAAIGLEPGWYDMYTYTLNGNFVEFDGQPDGRYVVVVGNDVDDDVLESDETNNEAYAVIDVAGDAVTVVERGFGGAPGGEPADDWLPHNPLVG